MIESFEYQSNLAKTEKCSFPWAADVAFFKTKKKAVFKPGLNIIFGGNGSGKSTLLKMIGTYLAATQGGYSCVTGPWLHDVFPGFSNDNHGIPGITRHDGQPILYFDARKVEGLAGGGFDDDFFKLGLENSMRRGSTGQLGLARLNRMLRLLQGEKPATTTPSKARATGSPTRAKDLARKAPKDLDALEPFPTAIEYKVPKNGNSYWSPRMAVVEEMLKPSIPLGPQTMIFDEPESGFSFEWQARLWNGVFAAIDPTKYQVIVATHSPFALCLPQANYIELEPGYIEQSRRALRQIIEHMEQV